MNESIADCYGMHIITSSFKTEFTRKGQNDILQVWEPERVDKTSEKELKKLANAFVDGHSGSSFSIGLAAFGTLGFSFLVVG
jgi:hypothetical protein